MSVASANGNNPQSSLLVCICTFWFTTFVLEICVLFSIDCENIRIVLFIYCTVLRIVLFITENSTVCKNNCSL